MVWFYTTNAILGGGGDVTINIKLRSGQNLGVVGNTFYSLLSKGTNFTTTNGVYGVRLLPADYTCLVAGNPQSFDIHVTNSTVDLYAAQITTNLVRFSGIQAVTVSGGLATTGPDGNGVLNIDASNVSGGGGTGTNGGNVVGATTSTDATFPLWLGTGGKNLTNRNASGSFGPGSFDPINAARDSTNNLKPLIVGGASAGSNISAVVVGALPNGMMNIRIEGMTDTQYKSMFDANLGSSLALEEDFEDHTNALSTSAYGNAAGLSSGTVASARLGTGGAGLGAKYLADDGTFKPITGGGDMQAANNLNDVSSKPTALGNLGGASTNNPSVAFARLYNPTNINGGNLLTNNIPSGFYPVQDIARANVGGTNVARLSFGHVGAIPDAAAAGLNTGDTIGMALWGLDDPIGLGNTNLLMMMNGYGDLWIANGFAIASGALRFQGTSVDSPNGGGTFTFNMPASFNNGMSGNASGLSSLAASQLTGTVPHGSLPAYVVTNNLQSGLLTNNGVVLYVTNGAPLVGLPNGSLCLQTSGQLWSRTNNAWVAINISGTGSGGSGDVVAANNLSEYTATAATARANIEAVSNNYAGTLTVAGSIITAGQTNQSLTASTLLKADANKKIVSIANGAGVLTNDASGNFGYAAISDASALKASQYMATDGSTNIVSTQNGNNWTNTIAYTHQGTTTNLTVTFNGTRQTFTITNGPTQFYHLAGGNGSVAIQIPTNITLHFDYNLTGWLGGTSNSVVTNGVLVITSFGGTNDAQLVEAIVEK